MFLSKNIHEFISPDGVVVYIRIFSSGCGREAPTLRAGFTQSSARVFEHAFPQMWWYAFAVGVPVQGA